MRVHHLNNLRALEAVLRKGGLRPAARELGVTPAAVGQQIRKLEEYLGLALLSRQPTGSLPTPHAMKVANALTRNMTGLSDVLDSLKRQNEPNRISLTVLPEFAEYWFPRHLATLFSEIPAIDLRIDTSREVIDLHAGEIDFAIRYSRKPSSDFAYELILDDYCAPICTPDFAKRYDISLDRASLENVPMAELDVANLGTTSDLPELVDWCARYAVVPPSTKSSQVILDYITAKKMGGSGLAILLGGIHDFIDELEQGLVVLPFGPDKVILNEHKFWLIWRSDLRISQAQKQFIGWVKQNAAKDRERVERFLSL